MPITHAAEQRFTSLGAHLEQENPVLLSTIQSFRDVDRVAQRMALISPEDSFASQVPWWPLISVLGTFSSGKSTFINDFVGEKLQRTGNQAVDDRFTVICYSPEPTGHDIPGVALDSDPRFPFYQISRDIEEVAKGEGRRIDSYLQLRTCPSERLRGKILIDSPGFDADAQRNATLRITDHIMDLSDLVLVFFDARHPEPGAMQDTLTHLVSNTIKRSDADKFLYILNQIDTAAREDNPEEVIAAWQRALGEKGLTAGRFYSIYSPSATLPITDETLRRRFEAKRDADLAEIQARIGRVEVERAYRIIGTLEQITRDIEERSVPLVKEALSRWRRRTLWGDVLVFGGGLAALLALNLASDTAILSGLVGFWRQSPILATLAAAILVGLALLVHFGIRSLAARSLVRWIRKQSRQPGVRGDVLGAFLHSTKPWRSLFRRIPVGWSNRARRRLVEVRHAAHELIQTLNDRYTSPSGRAPAQEAQS